MAVGEDRREAVGHALAEGIEALEGGGAAPGNEYGNRRVGLGEIEALEHSLDRGGHGR